MSLKLEMSSQRSSSSVPLQPNKIIINVGGNRFETYKSTLRNIPDTRLAWIAESKADNPDYDPITGEYFFDRHPSMFLMILNYYRTGRLHIPADVCGPAFEEELLFWGIDEKQIESCCWGNYSQHRDAQQTLVELKIDSNFEKNDEESEYGDDVGSTAGKFGITELEEKTSKWERIKPKLWAVLNNQSSSIAAKIFASISLTLTLTVITTFILETDPTCRIPRNKSLSYISKENLPFKEYRQQTKPHPVLFYIEVVCMCELTFETILRIVTCPEKRIFFKNGLNIVDVISLLSFYITSLLFLIDRHNFEDVNIAIQILRLVRVFRIFKVATHLPALKILFHTLKASARELLLMLMLILSLIICFATIIYFAEQVYESPRNDFTSIPIGFWWAIVTMTTLGYGDKTPKTALGYVFGSICAITGVLLIALPIPIIVNNFSTYYNHAKAQGKLPKKRKVPLVGAADALKQQSEGISLQNLQYNLHSTSCSRLGSPDTEDINQIYTRDKGSNETVNCIDSYDSDRSRCNDEKTMGGISVTFTDVDESEEVSIAQQRQCDQKGNGHLNYPSKSSHSVETTNNYNSNKLCPSDIRQQKIEPPINMANHRRASLLPGGVSSSPSTVPIFKVSVPTKTRTRERRRSLMPTIYTNETLP